MPMQRHTPEPTRGPGRIAVATVAAVGLLGLAIWLGTGCDGGTRAQTTTNQRPFAGAAVTVACPDPEFARELAGRCAAWAGRTGATVTVVPKPPAGALEADAAVIRPPEIGAFAARGELAAVPADLKDRTHPLQWDSIAAVYRNTVAGWAGEAVGLPLAGDGYVLVYRSDRLVGKDGKPVPPPATWEDVADAAEAVAAAGKPSLPPLPADGHRLLALFHHLAACYDRQVFHEDRPDGTGAGDAGLSLDFRADTWRPRLDAPGFAAAAEWFRRTRGFRATGDDDPVKALGDQGTAAVAVLSLAEVGRLPRTDAGEVRKEYRVAPLPGTRSYVDAGGKQVTAGRSANFVPFLGFDGQVGVVFRRSQAAAAAWDLLAELASPTSGTALLSNPALGAGPYRDAHTDPGVWLAYRFDADRTRDLAGAMSHYLGRSVTNPALAVRAPDQAELMAALEAEVRRAAAGQATGAEAMAAAAEAWRKHDAGRPADELVRWRRNAVGLP
jgi:ABC-type glycerol-3-phosphate transport system substrate-binding protein